MIVNEKRETYDGAWRVVMFKPDEHGRCHPELAKTELDENIDEFFIQRAEMFDRLRQQLIAGEISPIHFFMEYQAMTARDLASRMKISPRQINKHMTPKGFEGISVGLLRQYAKIFDICLSDFFQFLYVPDQLSITVSRHNGRLLEQIEIQPETNNEETVKL